MKLSSREGFLAVALSLVIALAPLSIFQDGSIDRSQLSDYAGASETVPVMDNTSALVEDGLAQFDGNAWVSVNEGGGYTVLNLGDPVFFDDGSMYLGPGITTIGHSGNVLSRIDLPANITGLYLDSPYREDACMTEKMGDGATYLYCAMSSGLGSSTYSSRVEYLDFPGERVKVRGIDSVLFSWWDSSGTFQDAWTLNYSNPTDQWSVTYNHPGTGRFAITDNGLLLHVSDSETFGKERREIGGHMMECPAGLQYWSNGWRDVHTCDAIIEIGRDGVVDDVVYMSSADDHFSMCKLRHIDIGPYGTIELTTGESAGSISSPGQLDNCNLYDINGTAMNYSFPREGHLIMDDDLQPIWNHTYYPCRLGNGHTHKKYSLTDVDWTPNGVYYVAVKGAGSSPCDHHESYWWADPALMHHSQSGPNITVGLLESNQSVAWSKTWRVGLQGMSSLNPNSQPYQDVYRIGIRASVWGFTVLHADGGGVNGEFYWDEGEDAWNGYTVSDWSATFSHDGDILDVFEPSTASGGFPSGNCIDVFPTSGARMVMESSLEAIHIRCQSSNVQQTSSMATQIVTFTPDSDRDGYGFYSDAFPFEGSQFHDIDNDGYGDNPMGALPDACPSEPGNSTEDRYGCPDGDEDGWSDLFDEFPVDPSQWADTDSDGYGDQLNGTVGDSCPWTFGESNIDVFGCPDDDYDGWSNSNDSFPSDSSQWADTDSDGYGDQFNGFQGDGCPSQEGYSHIDAYGCPDYDGDGWSDYGDAFPNDASQYSDIDGDGYGDNPDGNGTDVFPNNPTQWTDTDGDGYGDNQFGLQGDSFPEDASQSSDRDGDGYGDNPDGSSPDEFPSNPMQWSDTDGDGYGDNQFGLQGDGCPDEWGTSTIGSYGCPDNDGDGFPNFADAFPDNGNYWLDSDRDGYPDCEADSQNPSLLINLGTLTCDYFPFDGTQWSDVDEDGWGDNPNGPLADDFPEDPTQWEDSDGDGLGENPEGNNPDPYLNDYDNDGYNDTVDILPQLYSPGDMDADGVPDEQDLFRDDPYEWSDNDGDGIGDNTDSDDDNDGYSDVVEDSEGTDRNDASSTPVEAYQLMVPGTTIGLDAWDLIGIFGGGPIFLWLLFGFVTRNRRTRGIEERMEFAKSRTELNEIAQRTEYLLMLRLLGTHQGIKLERVRAELDDILEASEGTPIESFDHTLMVERSTNQEARIIEPHMPPEAEVSESVRDDLMAEEEIPQVDDLVGLADDLE